jgi:hypothetical protein
MEMLRAVDHYDPAHSHWTRTVMFDEMPFDKWLSNRLKVHRRRQVQPKRRPGAKLTSREKLASFIAEKYPSGIPAGMTNKQIAKEFHAATAISVSERTVRRAQGRE